MKEKTLKRLLCLAMAFAFSISNLGYSNVVNAAETETVIVLSDSGITVDGDAISTDETGDVYLKTEVETHPDITDSLKDIENSVVYITEAGTYRVSGEATDTQIKVDAEEDDEVTLVLDGVNISCRSASAIVFKNAYDPEEKGKAGAVLTINDGTTNIVNGGHVASYQDENDNKVKYDGAIESQISLLINGEGTLEVTADNEGIESKMHLTIDSGNISINASDDAINASEDGVSCITINGGTIYAYVSGNGGEGDGIDSNGTIVINGGFVVTQAHSSSQDSGLDSDNGVVINGGTVVATGNMYEGIDESSKQQYMQLYFSQTQTSTQPIVITDKDGDVVLAFEPINAFSIIELSDPDLEDGIFYVYQGGKIEGEEVFGSYISVTSYEKGTQLSHTGTMAEMQRPEMPADGQMPEMPEGMQRPEGMEGMQRPTGVMQQNGEMQTPPEMQADGVMPQGGAGMGMQGGMMGQNMQSNQARSYEFVLSDTEHVYQGVAAIDPATVQTNETNKEDGKNEQTGKFKDVRDNDWYKSSVDFVTENGIFNGTSENEFTPNGNMTRAMVVTVLYNLAGKPEITLEESSFTDVKEGDWYYDAVLWAEENEIVAGYTDGTFGTGDLVTREQLAVMLYNFVTIVDKVEISDEDLEKASLSYNDATSISSWASKGARYCNMNNLITGNTNNEFAPKASATRAEAATILTRYMNARSK